MVVWDKIKAMGTDVTISIVTSSASEARKDIEDANKVILEFEKNFSRFKKDNELHKLNNWHKGEMKVSDMMVDLLQKSKDVYKETNGIFDPTIVKTLKMYGYDESIDFDKGDVNIYKENSVDDIRQNFINRTKLDKLIIYKEKNIVDVPRGFDVDFGGIGKGYIVDLVAQKLKKKHKNFWISAGGDMYLFGKNEGSENWQVDFQNPLNFQTPMGSLDVLDNQMSIATSGITKRKGKTGDILWNHIINPKTGFCVQDNILMATVVANTVCDADVLAKTVLILGEKEGVRFIENRPHVECLLIDKNLKMHLSSGMDKYLVK